jgi:protocatechuate 3,4-dioxygenase beta subunit
MERMDAMSKKLTGQQRLSRRETFRLAGAAGALALVGRNLVGEPTAAQDTTTPSCVVTPSVTEGPYFVDELLNRSDIRVDPTDNTLREGVPLILKINVSRVDNGACTPLTGAYVDVWHCDALGVYSDIASEGSSGKKFLRGYQISDEKGAVQFTTIYPGWYRGRAVHTHFKVRLFAGTTKTYEFTYQWFFDESITDKVHALAPYSTKGTRDTLNTTDGIFEGTMGAQPGAPQQAPPGSGTTGGTAGTAATPTGEMLLLALTPVKEGDVSQGYTGTFNIGLTLT